MHYGRVPNADYHDFVDEPIIEITPAAIQKILEYRAEEPGDEEYGLLIEITGVRGNQFAYDLSFVPLADREDTDHLHYHGDLPVIIAQKDESNLKGAALDMSRDLLNPGMVMNNPNTPSPMIAPQLGELEGTVEERVRIVLDQHINPSIAAHGGAAELVAVEADVAYLRLMGGCQGCGLAAVTLRQGIERALVSAIPEINSVADITDHAAGDSPYYQTASK